MQTERPFPRKRLKLPTMVSRSPLVGAPATDSHQGDTAHLPSKKVVKETQREPAGLETPEEPKKEGQTLNRAQDVAELKDYVRIAAPTTKASDF